VASIQPALQFDDIVFDQFFTGGGFRNLGNQYSEARSTGRRRPGEQKESPGPDKNAFPKPKRPAEQHAGNTAQRTLVEKGQKGTGGGKHGHDFVHVVAQVVEKGHFIDLTIFQNHGNVLNGQNTQVGRQAESHFGEHRVNIGMPEYKPSPQGLPDIETQNHQGRHIAVKPDEDGKIDDIFQFIFAGNVAQKSGKKGAAAQGDDRKVGPDPQGKPIGVVHVGLVQSFEIYQHHGQDTPQQYATDGPDPQ
jgi:hypothetical protein